MQPPITNGRLIEGVSDETDRVLLINQIRDGLLNQQINAWPAVITTADATMTPVWSDVMPANSVADIWLNVVAQQVNTPANVSGYRRRVVAYRVGTGAVAYIGAGVDIIGTDKEAIAAWDAGFALDAANPGNIYAVVIGAAATSISWRANIQATVYPWT